MSAPSLYTCLLLAAASSSCAALDTERNLAPLYSEHWTAGGGVVCSRAVSQIFMSLYAFSRFMFICSPTSAPCLKTKIW